MYRIMLVEDDFALAGAMKKQLEGYENSVETVRDFHSVMSEFTEYDPHLVLMDIMLPFRDGYFWCAEIRKISSVPIVFISSASDNMNIVMAVNMGGDDFIAKPVDPMVLNAKVQAVLRRTYEINGSQGNPSVIEFNGGILDLGSAVVSCGGRSAELTKNEFRILQVLLENRGKIVSRDALMMRLWQSDLYIEENTLTVNVSRLRRKLEDCGMTDVIITKPGSGYTVK